MRRRALQTRRAYTEEPEQHREHLGGRKRLAVDGVVSLGGAEPEESLGMVHAALHAFHLVEEREERLAPPRARHGGVVVERAASWVAATPAILRTMP